MTAEIFNTKALLQTFFNEQISFMRENCKVAFLSHHFGDLLLTYALIYLPEIDIL